MTAAEWIAAERERAEWNAIVSRSPEEIEDDRRDAEERRRKAQIIQLTPTLAALHEEVAAPPAAAPAAPAPRPRLSPSQVATMQACPARWYYKHALKLPDPMTAPLAIGRAVHAGIEAALTDCDAIATFEQEFDRCWKEIPAASTDRQTAHDRAAAYLEIWIRQAAPAIGQDADCEQQLEGTIGDVPVKAKADIITENGRVIEVKTTYEKPRSLPDRYYLQAITYAMLAELDSVHVHVLCGSRSPSLQQFSIIRTKDTDRYAEILYTMTADQIQSGLYPPRRGASGCSRTSCAYWQRCIQDHGGDVPQL
ncbi:MAG: PD-(D/E)XK nuclease family protein [Bryobacterales bacterium]|nr:PD-(D/E)XK nuclease family protein [Bryobacterales bacterium]